MESRRDQAILRYFYPRPLRGGRRRLTGFAGLLRYFYPRPLRGGRRLWRSGSSGQHRISIHALCEEGDPARSSGTTTGQRFLSTPSARRATKARHDDLDHDQISIHALCEEGDFTVSYSGAGDIVFLSTPSARRATDWPRRQKLPDHYFYPRPLRGGRLAALHSTRTSEKFLSTPSARRATIAPHWPSAALRNFYPRPLRGGRHRVHKCGLHFHEISIHALCEEGDSKNGEKHLRFCFIIKRSAQIWKSFSKNI